MPKGKLKLATAKMEQLKAVAELNEVKLLDSKVLGETTFVEVNYKQVQQIFEMGGMINSVTAAEAKAITEVSQPEKQTEKSEVKK